MEPKVPSKARRVLSIVFNVVFYFIIAVLFIFSIANIQVRKENNIANIFGIGMLSVQSDSMHGTFDTGDMLFVEMLDDESRQDIKVDDIVTYFDRGLHEFITHRVVEVNLDEDYIVTQADYNYIDNNNVTSPDDSIPLSEAIAVYTDAHIVGFGRSLDYLQSPTGFAICVILPVVIFLIIEGVILARNIMAVNKNKLEEQFAADKETALKDLEAEKEKMRAEILAELKKQKPE